MRCQGAFQQRSTIEAVSSRAREENRSGQVSQATRTDALTLPRADATWHWYYLHVNCIRKFLLALLCRLTCKSAGVAKKRRLVPREWKKESFIAAAFLLCCATYFVCATDFISRPTFSELFAFLRLLDSGGFSRLPNFDCCGFSSCCLWLLPLGVLFPIISCWGERRGRKTSEYWAALDIIGLVGFMLDIWSIERKKGLKMIVFLAGKRVCCSFASQLIGNGLLLMWNIFCTPFAFFDITLLVVFNMRFLYLSNGRKVNFLVFEKL